MTPPAASIRRGLIYSFDAATWTAVVQLDGSVGEVVMPVGEWVPSGMLALDDGVAVLLFDASNPDDGLILGPYGGVSGWSYPALSGLTTGQPLRATGAAAAAFGALDLANANAVTGALPHGKGGTGLTGTPSNGQVPIGNGSGYALAALAGTTNRVSVTNGAGTITLSTPQDTHTGASPTFAGATLNGDLSLSGNLSGANWVRATTYTPTWSGTGSNPSLGNGTLQARYARLGDLVLVWLLVTMGSTTTYGTGVWEFTLPVSMGGAGRFVVGVAQALDAGVADYVGVCRGDDTTDKLRVIFSSGASAGPTAPHTWGSGDSLALTFAYQA